MFCLFHNCSYILIGQKVRGQPTVRTFKAATINTTAKWIKKVLMSCSFCQSFFSYGSVQHCNSLGVEGGWLASSTNYSLIYIPFYSYIGETFHRYVKTIRSQSNSMDGFVWVLSLIIGAVLLYYIVPSYSPLFFFLHIK